MIKLFGGNKFIDFKSWTFPGGERNVKILEPTDIDRYKSFTIHCIFEGSEDIIDIMLLVNAVRNINRATHLRLCIPYFPFARQDRVMTAGEPLALQVMVNLIKSCKFDEVEVWDPHSDVLASMFEPGTLLIKTQEELMKDTIKKYCTPNEHVALISPDAGASKKIYKLAKTLGWSVIEANKVRDVATGQITGTKIDTEALQAYDRLIVVDDICDGGRTFIELAKVITKHTEARLELYVTHGIFSKGREVLEEYFDRVECINSLEKNNV